MIKYAKVSGLQKVKNRVKKIEDEGAPAAAHASTHSSGQSDTLASYFAVTAHGAAHSATGSAALSSYYCATAHGAAHASGQSAGLESYFAVTAHGVAHGPSGSAPLDAYYSVTTHTHAGGSGALTLNTASTLPQGSATNTVTITPTTNMALIIARIGAQSGSLEAGIQFNSDTAANYTYRQNRNGTYSNVAGDTKVLLTAGNSVEANESILVYILITNISGKNKVFHIVSPNQGGTYSPELEEFGGRWNNTASQLTSITIYRTAGAGTWDDSTFVRVYTYSDS